MEKYQKKIIKDFIESLKMESSKKVATKIICDLPQYWYEVPASSSGKYHPRYTVRIGGLFLHSSATEKLVTYMLSLEQYRSQFSDELIDAMRIAAFCHDGLKQGVPDSDGKTKGTIFSHPKEMAEKVRSYKTGNSNEDTIYEFIANCIESHMGEWNTNKREPTVVLQKPETLAQQLVHLADYLASRKDIEIKFNSFTDYGVSDINSSVTDLGDYVFTFGKIKGRKLRDVYDSDLGYLQWIIKNGIDRDGCYDVIQKFFESKGINT